MSHEEWCKQHDRICPSTLRHREIASKFGNQMTQLGNGVTVFHLYCEKAAIDCLAIMSHDFDATHRHTRNGNQIEVTRKEAPCTK